MAKYRIDNGKSSLDPFADFKAVDASLGVKTQANINPYQGMDTPNIAETFSGAKLDEGFSLLGNSNLALATQKQTKYQEQGITGLLAKGIGRTLGKIGTEVLKMPGYAVGAALAIGNETIGDGKNSMALAVDNAWLRTMSSLDQGIKDQLPVTISQEIEDGSIWDKAASGSWWATQGADGVGFMLSMFVPGAATKLLGAGKAIAGLTEVLANVRRGKGIQATGKLIGSTDEIAALANQPYRAGLTFERNADGVTAALMNTTLESMAEAADTYQQAYKGFQEKVKTGEMSDDKAKELAGSQASSVFKSNLAMLMVSNLADQAFIWKAFGKGPSKSDIAKIVESTGENYLDAVNKLSNKGYKQIALDYAKSFAANASKEALEEGVQTITQQNAASGRDNNYGLTAAKDLAGQLGGIFTGDDTFWNNKELHESMFLGAVLGGGMGLIGGVKDNLDLKRQLNGYNRATTNISPAERLAQKLGFKRETKDQKGLKSLIQDSWLKNFKSDLNSLKGADGALDIAKVDQAFESGNKEVALHAIYDAAVASGDTVTASKFGTYLAQHYVQPFLGQAGMDQMFGQHVENQVAPAWAERFEANNDRPATKEEVAQFKEDFTKSGQRVFRAYEESERTNYPERYYKGEGDNLSYAKFRQKYFQGKFETLLELDALNLEKTKLNQDLQNSGLLSKVSEKEGRYRVIEGVTLTPVEARNLDEYNQRHIQIKSSEEKAGEIYNQFFTKDGVKSIYDLSKQMDQSYAEVQKDIEKENEDLIVEKQSVEQEVTINAAEMQSAVEAMEGLEGNPVMAKNTKTGVKQPIIATPEGIAFVSNESIFNKVDSFSIQIRAELFRRSTSEEKHFSGKDFMSVGVISAIKSSGETLSALKITTELGKDIWLNNDEWWDYYTKTNSIDKLLEPADFADNKVVNPNEPDAEIIAQQQNNLDDFQDIEYPEAMPVIGDQETERQNDRVVETEFVELGKLNTTDRTTTGRHIEYDTIDGRLQDRLTPDGLPVLGTVEQQRWQNTIDKISNPAAYQGEIVSIGKLKDLHPERYAQVLQSSQGEILQDSDLWVFLHKDNQPVMLGENYVFTSLYTPEKMYQNMSQFRVAQNYWLSNYAKATNQEIPTSPAALRTFKETAFDAARADYTKWYEGLRSASPIQLQVNEVTNGHMLTKKDVNGDIVWNKAAGNIPGVTIDTGLLKGGDLVISETGEIESGGRLLKVNKGDVVVTTKDGIYPMRNRNLNSSEIDTVINLITKVTPEVSLTDLRQEGEFPISAYETETSLGIFYEQNKNPLIRYLMNWGGSGQGSINIGQGNQSVVFQPFGADLTVTLPIADLSNKSSQAYQQLKNFLGTKRYNVTKELLSTGNAFAKPTIVSGQFKMTKQNKSYVEYLMTDVLQTMSVNASGYPSRLQRNLHLGEPISKVDLAQATETTARPARGSRKALAQNLSLDADKIFTVDELIQQKLISGEIKQTCV